MNHRAWILALDLFELSVKGKLVRIRNRYIKSVAKTYENSQVISNAAKQKHIEELREVLSAHYTKVTNAFRSKVRTDAKRSGYKLETKSAYDILIAEWIATEVMRKAKMINDTDTQDIIDAIEDGMLTGASIADISKSIRDKTALSPFRAQTIARTETHNAATYSSLQSIREVEQETGAKFMKQWISTSDIRTRDAHAEMRGSEPIPVDEKFFVGGEYLDRPGDSAGSPENIINCRCQVIFMEQ